MESLDPYTVGTATLTAGVAFAMAWLGTKMGLLESRTTRRRCPSCGHLVERTRCRCTS